MEMTDGSIYQEFSKDTAKILLSLINRFSFRLISGSDYEAIYASPSCQLEFYLEHDILSVYFSKPGKGKMQFSVENIYKILNPSSKLPCDLEVAKFKDGRDRIRQKLQLYESCLTTYFDNVLKGDFSWEDEYKKTENIEKSLITEVLKLSNDNPIRQKFWQQDPSWKSDMLKYLEG